MKSYQEDIQSVYENRCQGNASYSLRAFARDLGVSPGFLSNILKKRKNLSESTARDISKRLFESKKDQNSFVSKVRIATCKDGKIRDELSEQILNQSEPSDVQVISHDKHQLVSDWVHGYIVEYSQIKNFGKSEADSLSKKIWT